MKKLLALALCFVLAITCICFSAASASEMEEKYQLNTSTEYDIQKFENIKRANKILTELICSFAENYPVGGGKQTYDGLTIEQYPDYYGGAYINKFGNLVVMLTDMSAKETLASLIDTDYVEFRKASYPKKHLLTILDAACDYCNSNDNHKFELVSVKIDDYNNCVRVHLRVLNAETIAEFENEVMASDAIVYYEDKSVINEEVSYMNVGKGITTDKGG